MAMPAKDVTGVRSGLMVAIKIVGKRGGANLWECICDCGNTTHAIATQILRGEKTSCGCKKKHKRKPRPDVAERSKMLMTTHGMTGERVYDTWRSMKHRCENERSKDYPRYGGRGISVCDEWSKSFESFYEYMGDRPEGTTIDRIDTNGNYEPNNVRWATNIQQGNNRRTNNYVEVNGTTKTVTEWAREYGLEPKTLAYRIRIGWDLMTALETPPIIKRK